MPYVMKNSAGKIVGLYENQQDIKAEWLEEENVAVQNYRHELSSQAHSKSDMETSDLDLIRVIEDLTELLIKKQVIAFTELPIFAQQKLGTRQKMRSDMVSLKSLINEADEGLF